MPEAEQETQRMDHVFDSVEIMIGEIHYLMLRLEEMHPDAMTRLEQLMAQMRVRRSVEKHCH